MEKIEVLQPGEVVDIAEEVKALVHVCAWCKPQRILDDGGSGIDDIDELKSAMIAKIVDVTHGMCLECVEREYAEIEAEEEEEKLKNLK